MRVALILALYLQGASSVVCNAGDTSALSLDDYRHCILSAQIVELRDNQDELYNRHRDDTEELSNKVSGLQIWQNIIKGVLGLSGAGLGGLGTHRGVKYVRKRMNGNGV